MIFLVLGESQHHQDQELSFTFEIRAQYHCLYNYLKSDNYFDVARFVVYLIPLTGTFLTLVEKYVLGESQPWKCLFCYLPISILPSTRGRSNVLETKINS